MNSKDLRLQIKRAFSRVLSPVVLVAALLTAGAVTGQNIFYHLLPDGVPTANFTSASQTVAESSGVWTSWPASLNSWTKRRQIDLASPLVLQTNFPVMVKLDATRISYASVQAAGQDLRFTDSSGTVLDHEIESWNAAGTSIVWVKIPSYAAYPTKNSIWMYYGNAVAADGQNRIAVWDASSVGVWHLSGSGADATTNANNGTVTGAVAGAGLAGDAMAFAGGTNLIRPPDTLWSNRTVGTLEGWFNTTSTDVPLFGWSTTANPTAPGSHVPSLYVGNDGKLRGEQWWGSSAAMVSSSVVNDGVWHHVALVLVSANSQILYLDGVQIATLGGSITTFASTVNYLGSAFSSSWPASAGGWRSMNGLLDEFRISSTARSADWIALNYQSIKDLLAIYGLEETPATGAAIVTVQLSQAAPATVTIPYVVSGTATAGLDHARISGNLTINAGASSGSLDTQILRDDLVEGSETAILTLGAATGATTGADNVHTITITDEVLSPPDAVDDIYIQTNFSSQILNVLANDSDPNGDVLQITAISAPGAGTATRVGQTIQYTPNGDFGASDSFTYTISDGRGGSDTATVTINYQIPFTWIGAGADANWTTLANWQGGAVPGASDTAYFNDACTTFCNPIQTSNISVGGLRMNSSYAGTIAQASGFTWTLAAGDWTQRAGSFMGANAAVNLNFGLNLYGGIYTATSVTTTLGTGACSTRRIFDMTGGTFNHGNGRVKVAWARPSYGSICHATAEMNYPVGLTFYDFETSSAENQAWTSNLNATSATALTVENNFYDYGHSMAINIDLKGHLFVNTLEPGFNNGTWIRMMGTGNQEYSYVPSSYRTNVIKVDKTSGTVTPAAGTTSLAAWAVQLLQGSFQAPSGILTLGSNSSGGTLDSLLVAAGTTFDTNSGTVRFTLSRSGSTHSTSNISVPVGFAFNNAEINGLANTGGWYSYTTASTTLKVLGNFVHSGTINNANWEVAGGVTVSGAASGGSGTIKVNGTGAQSVTQSVGAVWSGTTVTIDKATGTSTQTSAVTMGTAGQNLTINDGIHNMAGFALTVANTVAVGATAKLLCNGGVLTAASYVINGEVSCGPSVGITWTGLAGDNLWNTAGNWTNNTIPGASDIALFNGMCAGANCNVTMPAVLSVKGIKMNTGYTGTITAGATSVTVGTSGWTQVAGTFDGGAAPMTLNGPFALSGGTFTATSGTLTSNVTAIAGWSITGAPTFNHGSGTVLFYGWTNVVALNMGTTTFNNLTLQAHQGTYNITGTMTANATLTLNNTFTTSGTMNGGTINAVGDVVTSGTGFAGTTLVKVAGTGNQTVSGVLGAYYPRFEVASTGGTVTYSGVVCFRENYTHTSGTMAFGASTIRFYNSVSTTTITPGAVAYGDVTFAGYASQFILVGSMTVNGTLTFADTHNTFQYNLIQTGTFLASGDVVFTGIGYHGSSLLKMVGTGNQTVTAPSTAAIMNFEVASTGGTVTYSGTLYFRGNYTYTSGVVSTTGSTVSFSNSNTTTTITPGTVAYNNVTFAGWASAFTLVGSMTVNGLLTLADTHNTQQYNVINGGTFLASGDVSVSNIGYHGTSLLRLVGTGNQTITSSATASLMNFEVASTGGTVTFVGTLSIYYGNYTYVSGTVDTGTSTLTFYDYVASKTITPGPVVYNNVSIGGVQANYSIVGTMTTNGTLTLADTNSASTRTVNTGTLLANGDVTLSSYGKSGTAALTFAGSTSKNFTIAATALRPAGTITIAKTGGASVILQSNGSFGTAGQDVTVASGILDLGGYDLTVTDVLTVDSGATLRCNGGTFTQGTLVNNGTLSCPGYSSYEFNWTGTSADGNWNTAANWQGGVAPTASSIVVFDDAYCGANCNALMDAAVSVKGVMMMSGYTGTITQGAGNTVTVGSAGWSQAGGTFVGSDAALTYNLAAATGLFSVTGGTFTSTTGELTVARNNFTSDVSNKVVFRVGASATFVHNSGTVKLACTETWNGVAHYGIDAPSGLTFNHLIMQAGGGYGNGHNVSAGQTVTVLGNFDVLNGTLGSGGTLQVYGNVSINSNSTGTKGLGNLKLIGTANQTYAHAGTREGPKLEIDKTGGTVTPTTANAKFAKLIVTNGTFTAPTGTLRVGYDAATDPGATTMMSLSSPAAFIDSGGTLQMYGYDGWTNNYTFTWTFGGNLTVTNAEVIGSSGSKNTISGGSKLITTGTFTHTSSVLAGSIEAKGAAVFNSTSKGAATVAFTGTSAQTITGTNPTTGTWTVNKPSGSVVLANALNLSGGAQALTISSGTFDMAGYALTVAGAVTNSGTLKRGNSPSCGTLTTGSFSGTAAICP